MDPIEQTPQELYCLPELLQMKNNLIAYPGLVDQIPKMLQLSALSLIQHCWKEIESSENSFLVSEVYTLCELFALRINATLPAHLTVQTSFTCSDGKTLNFRQQELKPFLIDCPQMSELLGYSISDEAKNDT